jgi:hypothetical protein
VEAPDYDRTYLARLENRLTVRALIVDLMDKYNVDALVHPFKSLAAPPIGWGPTSSRFPTRASPRSLSTTIIW